jgi:hypothetical protein
MSMTTRTIDLSHEEGLLIEWYIEKHRLEAPIGIGKRGRYGGRRLGIRLFCERLVKTFIREEIRPEYNAWHKEMMKAKAFSSEIKDKEKALKESAFRSQTDTYLKELESNNVDDNQV